MAPKANEHLRAILDELRYHNLRMWGSTALAPVEATPLYELLQEQQVTYRNNSPVSYTDPLFVRPVLSNPTAKVLSTASPTVFVTSSTDMTVTAPAVVNAPAVVRDARNAIITGVEFTIPNDIPSFSAGNTAAIAAQRGLAVNGITGTAYFEGCYIRGSRGMSECAQVLGGGAARVVFVNCRFEGAKSFQGDAEAYNSQHPDLLQILQCYGIYIRNCTLVHSSYQGFYATNSSGPITELYFENVNFGGIRRQPLWLNNPGTTTLPVIKRLSNVYNMQYWSTDPSPSVRPAFPGGYGSDHKNYSYYDSNDYPYDLFAAHTLTGDRFAGEVLINDPEVIAGAKILRGLPPDGDYAPADKVGLLYDADWFENQYRLRVPTS